LRAKKNIPAWNIPTDFSSVGILHAKKKYSRLKYTDGFLVRRYIVSYRRQIAVGKSVGECIYRQNISVCKFIGECVKCWRINSVGNSVDECLKYRPNSSVGKILGNSFFLNLFLKNYLGYII
jgi:hypothetical protein